MNALKEQIKRFSATIIDVKKSENEIDDWFDYMKENVKAAIHEKKLNNTSHIYISMDVNIEKMDTV